MKELSIEKKELLLKDLCARLPYGVMCHINDDDTNTPRKLSRIEVDELDGILLDFWTDREDYLSIQVYLSEVKPYLRPMSSMTEEELMDFANIKFKDNAIWEIVEFPKMKCYKGFINVKCKNKNNGDTWTFQVNTRTPLETYYGIDWLNAHHFDYRGLIEKGLALEATKENNPYK